MLYDCFDACLFCGKYNLMRSLALLSIPASVIKGHGANLNVTSGADRTTVVVLHIN